jgi:hypothetical protein
MILILSHSLDRTTDIIVEELNPYPVFRWNIDLWSDYSINITNSSFRITDPEGRVAQDEVVHAVYLRKLFFNPCSVTIPQGGNEESWRRAEIESIWLGIRDLAHEQGKLALVHPAPSGSWQKIRQMRVASDYFKVPNWWVVVGDAKNGISDKVVAKTFSGSNINGGLVAVQEVDPARLSPDFPWFLQSKMQNATHDVTVAWVDGEIFAYQADRSAFAGDDVRASDVEWHPVVLNKREADSVSALMSRTGYSFARLDFLKVDGELWFLEINPNGQFAWLDIDCKGGLIKAVTGAITRVWERNRRKAES